MFDRDGSLEKVDVARGIREPGDVLSFADQAAEFLDKANANLQPELLASEDARALLEVYARAGRLAAFGIASLSRKLDDAAALAQVTGTSFGKAKATVATGKALAESEELGAALQHGDISLDQAAEIASAEQSCPGAAPGLIEVASKEAFHVLREKARKVKLEAEATRDLFARQKAARSSRTSTDELGMIHIDLRFEPHVGAPIMARAEAHAARLARRARAEGKEPEPFACYLADAYAEMLSEGNTVKGSSTRPDLVVLVGHEVIKRGWTDVREGEVCKIPGIGPISPAAAKAIAQDAFLTGVFYDGKDLRNICRYTRHIPIEVRLALELGPPPGFDGVRCVVCGNRLKNQIDHIEPRAANGPTSNANLGPLCRDCHDKKTEEDRRAGKLKPGATPTRSDRPEPATKSKRKNRRAGKVKLGGTPMGTDPPEPAPKPKRKNRRAGKLKPGGT